MTTTFTRGTRAHGTSITADVATGYTACSYRARRPARNACTAASVTIDTAPQAFTDFGRWVDETVQNASIGSGTGLAPEQIDGLGRRADWVPGTRTLETATLIRWVAVRLTCPGGALSRLHLAKALARAALASG